MSSRRVIRLKETSPGLDELRPRPEGYLEQTDGTVGEGPWPVRTDEHGFIATGNDIPEDLPGIVFLGDSFVEATFTPERTRFVSIVERELQRHGHHVRCLNGGYSGATLLQLFNVFINKVVPLVGKGGTVVLCIPQSDIPIYFRPQSYWYPTDRYSPVLPPFEPVAESLPKGREATASILRLLISAAEEFGISLILVSSPHRHSNWEDDEYYQRVMVQEQHDSLTERRRDIRAAIAQVVRETRAPFIDADAELMKSPDWFYDELHLNDEGHEKFAALIMGKLPTLISDGAAKLQAPEAGAGLSERARIEGAAELLGRAAHSTKEANDSEMILEAIQDADEALRLLRSLNIR